MSASDLSVSLHELAPHTGSRSEQHLAWTVREGWSSEVLTLPAGNEVGLDVALTTIDDGVLVQVTGDTQLVGECVRCLDPLSVPVNIAAAELYVESPTGKATKPGKKAARKPANAGSSLRDDAGIEAEGDDLDAVLTVQNDAVDLEPLLRDAIFSDAPLQPTCREDCQGICAHCGVRLADAEPGHSHQFVDPRFAALEGFFDE